MQEFPLKYHDKFKKYFNIKENPTQVELDFYAKTEKYLRYIKWVPGLRMIWIWNSISMNSSTKDSDIDLYVVTTRKSMWFNRIIITLIFQILWVRKTENKHAWKFCLSFFSSLKWMNFSSWKIENDIYLYFWIVYFKPILDYNNTYSLFIEENSSWARFSSYNNILNDNKNYIKYKKNINNNDNYLVIILDKIIKLLFIWKTLKTYSSLWKPFWVIINDNLLKFHNNDIRKKTKEELL